MNDMSLESVASKVSITSEYLEYYGTSKAKVSLDIIKDKERNGKLILMTSTSPTPYGEGKTTMTISLHDALNEIGVKSLAVLREPSMGPVFGFKGGATGGGKAIVLPEEDINLHFTGDFHAITSANNLIASAIDNHIYFGNKLKIKDVVFKRCLDLNDRALREVNLLNRGNLLRKDSFTITAASEMMAIFCLATDINDLAEKVGNIIAGYDNNDNVVLVKSLDVVGAVLALLKDAIKPNLVKTLYNNPVLIHGGPFANIAHGCNSVIATDMALKLADYVVTEAGFGSDLGAIKFFDMKCRAGKFRPDLVIVNTTIRSLKYNGDSLEDGISNLEFHIKNVAKFSKNVMIVINRFDDDTDAEIEFVKSFVRDMSYVAYESTGFKDGGSGSIDLAWAVISMLSNSENEFKFLYDLDLSIKEKVEFICSNIYGANNIKYTKEAEEDIKKIEVLKIKDLMLCISKTQYSISDNKDLLGFPKDFPVLVTGVDLSLGAGFVVIKMGDVYTMPGLNKNPSYEKISLVDGLIKGMI